jgi:hypothetical protein
LFDDELIKRNIIVECRNDIVAITPRVGERGIPPQTVIPVRLAIPGDIEPIPTPAFTEMPTGEQFLDQLCDGLLSMPVIRREEVVGFLRCGGETDEIKIQPAHQDARRGILSGGQFPGFHLTQREVIERSSRPVRHPNFRDGGRLHRLQRPQIRLQPRCLLHLPLRSGCARVRSAVLNPGDEVSHGLLGKLLLRGHLQAIMFERPQNQTFIRLSSHERGAGFAPGENPIARIEQQLSTNFISIRGVALVTTLHQNGPDLRFKEGHISLRGTRNDDRG